MIRLTSTEIVAVDAQPKPSEAVTVYMLSDDEVVVVMPPHEEQATPVAGDQRKLVAPVQVATSVSIPPLQTP